MSTPPQYHDRPAILPSPRGSLIEYPTVMIEEELIHFLRIPEISQATDHRHVMENLKRGHGLPRIHLCGKTIYLTDTIRAWLQQHVTCGR